MCLCNAPTYRRIACFALLRGLRGCLWARELTATNVPSRPSENFLVLMARFLSPGCPNWAGSRRPVTITPNVRRDALDATVMRRETRKPLHPLDRWRVHPHCLSVAVRTAEPTQASCTEDVMVEQSQVCDGPFEITLHYRSFASNHAPHVCGNNTRRSSRDAAKSGDAPAMLSPAGHTREYSCVLPIR